MGTQRGTQLWGHRDMAMGTQGDVALGLGDGQGANEGQGAASGELWGWGPPGLGLWSTGTWGDAGLWGRDTGLWGCPEVSLSSWGPFPWVWGLRCAPALGSAPPPCIPGRDERDQDMGIRSIRVWGRGAVGQDAGQGTAAAGAPIRSVLP